MYHTKMAALVLKHNHVIELPSDFFKSTVCSRVFLFVLQVIFYKIFTRFKEDCRIKIIIEFVGYIQSSDTRSSIRCFSITLQTDSNQCHSFGHSCWFFVWRICALGWPVFPTYSNSWIHPRKLFCIFSVISNCCETRQPGL